MSSPRNRVPGPLRRPDGSSGARPDQVPCPTARAFYIEEAPLQRLDDLSRVRILRIDLRVFSPDPGTGAARTAGTGRPDGFHRLHAKLDGEAAAPGLAITLRRSAIESRLRALTRAPLAAPLVFEPRLFLSPCRRVRVEDRLRHLLEGLRAGEGPEAVASLEAALMAALLTACRHNYSRRVQPDGAAALPRHLKRVEAYILQNADKPISMKDLEGVAAVSARSIHHAFRRFRGSSPKAWLQALRLDRAHQALLAAAPGDRVMTIAARCGFVHLGRFSAAYRKRFGELPSQTLGRR